MNESEYDIDPPAPANLLLASIAESEYWRLHRLDDEIRQKNAIFTIYYLAHRNQALLAAHRTKSNLKR